MNRRQFSQFLAGATLLAAARPERGAAAATVAEPTEVSDAARRLYASALILDCNSSPPLPERLPLSAADLELVRNSGINVIKLSLGGINSDFAHTVAEIARVQQLFEIHPDYFTPVRSSGDIARAQRERKVGIILSFESVEMLGGQLSPLELFRNLGVRVMQLSYNRTSAFAAGVMAPRAGGLTALGHEAVREMNRLGIAVDISHANPASTADVLTQSSQPPVMTHAGCAAIHSHPRNKSDEQLRALAARGGVVGIYDLPYLTASPRQPTVDDYMAHLVHALQVAGEDHVGIGSDVGIAPFDSSPAGMADFSHELKERRAAGLSAPEEDRPTYVVGLNVPRRMEIIADRLLRSGYSASVTEKVLGANFARVFTQIWGT
ncbi:MAG: membrane dipeptidase [Gammaproteobacteria bacterium]|nr:membrane dipeptidase [Gammaproteobacteria bacterium]MBV9726067.1 membrane dipeptidase [Gammaproteobacteria bacterium]